jgi:hypothetical protein
VTRSVPLEEGLPHHASNVHVRMLLEEHGWSFAPQTRLLLLPTHAPEKPGIVLHTTRLTRGILRINRLIKKQSGMVMSTAMPHLSSGYSATTEKA